MTPLETEQEGEQEPDPWQPERSERTSRLPKVKLTDRDAGAGMNPLGVAALCICSFVAGIAAMLAGGYLWLDRSWRH